VLAVRTVCINMGCFASKPATSPVRKSHSPRPLTEEEKRHQARNDEIDAALAKARKDANIVKVLLLGSGESGKSTVLKQMRLLHGDGFTSFERKQYTIVIWCDTVQSMRILIQQAKALGITLDCDDVQSPLHRYKNVLLNTDEWDVLRSEVSAESRAFLSKYNVDIDQRPKKARQPSPDDPYNLDYIDDLTEADLEEVENPVASSLRPSREEVAEAIHELWTNDSGILNVYSKANLFQLEVNAKHYFEHVFDYSDPKYEATDTDILVGRIKTTGIFQMVFNVNGTPLKMFDVGGQRSERKKWIHAFDNVTAVLFVAAVSEYDEVLFEDEDVNRITESLELFDQICNSRWFRNTPMILFLNKIDILERKLKKSPITDYYPEYSDDPLNADKVCDFLEAKYMSRNRVATRPVYVRRTCATDTKSMAFVMSAATDMVFQRNLNWSGVV
jgi:hypothetical protein